MYIYAKHVTRIKYVYNLKNNLARSRYPVLTIGIVTSITIEPIAQSHRGLGKSQQRINGAICVFA